MSLFKHLSYQFGGNQFGHGQSSYRKKERKESAPGWELIYNLCLIAYKPNEGRAFTGGYLFTICVIINNIYLSH